MRMDTPYGKKRDLVSYSTLVGGLANTTSFNIWKPATDVEYAPKSLIGEPNYNIYERFSNILSEKEVFKK